MKPIIGIITRPGMSEENNKIYCMYEDISKAIYKNGGIPLGIFPINNIKEVLSICDGVIFQGGNNFTNYEKEYIKYAYETDLPTLGICLGMQLMNIFLGAQEYEVSNHKQKTKKYAHKVIIDNNSILFKILKEKEIYVNSRHTSAIKNTPMNVSAISTDNVIEAVEDKNKKCFIGLEWHPENMVEYDKNSNKIFKYFINKCKS